jgi:hypothetical protein
MTQRITDPLAPTVAQRVRVVASESQQACWDIAADHAWSEAFFEATGRHFADTDTRDALLAASAAMRHRTDLTEA